MRWIKTKDDLPNNTDLVVITGKSKDSSSPRSIIRLAIFNSLFDGNYIRWFDAGHPEIGYEEEYDIEWWCKVEDPLEMLGEEDRIKNRFELLDL